MASDLVFPDGVRLPRLDELPGPESARMQDWARIQGAKIQSGFVIADSSDPGFTFYAEANVDADKIWSVFCDLCEEFLAPSATLVMSEVDEEPAPVGKSEVSRILRSLDPHSYQLAHDGFLQFGLVRDAGNEVSEVFVTPTKHFQIWFRDSSLFKAVMKHHGIPEVELLRFIDQYPRVTTALPIEKVSFRDVQGLIAHIEGTLARAPDA